MWFYEFSSFYLIVACYVVRLSPRTKMVFKVTFGSFPLGLAFHSLIFHN